MTTVTDNPVNFQPRRDQTLDSLRVTTIMQTPQITGPGWLGPLTVTPPFNYWAGSPLAINAGGDIVITSLNNDVTAISLIAPNGGITMTAGSGGSSAYPIVITTMSNSGTNDILISDNYAGAGAIDQVTISSTNSTNAAALNFSAPLGGITSTFGTNFTAVNNVATPAATIMLGGTTQTGTITIGRSTAGQTVAILNSATAAASNVNILSGAGTAGVASLNMADNPRVSSIDLGNVAPATARVTTIAGGNATVNDTVTIMNGNPSSGTQTVDILAGTPTGGTQVLNLGNASGALTTKLLASTGGLTLGSAPAGGLLITNNTTIPNFNQAGAITTTVSIGAGNFIFQITTQAATASAATPNQFLVTNNAVVTANSIIRAEILTYSGAGTPLVFTSLPSAGTGGSFTVTVATLASGTPLNAALTVLFFVINLA